MIETKKCPYCAEEINIAAIKCKHCGEFLETRHKSPENTHSHTTHHTIAKQNFNLAIFLCVTSITLSIGIELFTDVNNKLYSSIILFSIVAEIQIAIYLSTYLKNFQSPKALIMANWNIVMLIVSGITFLFIDRILLKNGSIQNQYNNDLIIWIYLVFIMVMLASFIVRILLGRTLQNIKNDTVGLLKELGLSYVILSPIVMFLAIYSLIVENSELELHISVIDSISNIILIVIFVRAQRLMFN